MSSNVSPPVVSVIIPAYNSGKYIEETIQSVKQQTFNQWELLIIDDGSTDNTSTTILPYLSDKRIQYHYQKNKGVSAARNKGIELSKGTYIAFLDADDVWLPMNLEKKIMALLPDTIDWVFSDALLLFNNDKVIVAPEGTDKLILEHYLLWDRMVVPGPSSNIVLKRKCFNKGLRFDPMFSTAADQDFCFYLTARYQGKRIAEPLFKYRQLTNSMSKDMRVVSKDHYNVYRKAESNKLFKSYLFKNKCFSNMYIILAGGWWSIGGNIIKTIIYLIKAIIIYPPNTNKLMAKFLKKLTRVKNFH